jgi:16S rRNA processing protein RimM
MPEAARPDQPFLVVARIVSTQGNKGEVKAELVTDFPERFASTPAVYVGDEHRRFEMEGYRLQGRVVILKLRGVDSMDEAQKLRGALVQVPEEDAVKLPAGHYFWHQIVGLKVMTIQGEDMGTVDDILPTGSNDVYVIHGPRGELLVPAIKDVVKAIDLEKGVMTVELLPWLD